MLLLLESGAETGTPHHMCPRERTGGEPVVQQRKDARETEGARRRGNGGEFDGHLYAERHGSVPKEKGPDSHARDHCFGILLSGMSTQQQAIPPDTQGSQSAIFVPAKSFELSKFRLTPGCTPACTPGPHYPWRRRKRINAAGGGSGRMLLFRTHAFTGGLH